MLNGRLHVLQMLAHPLTESYTALAEGTKTAGFSYESTVPLAGGQHLEIPDEQALHEALLSQLEANRKREVERGISLVGPHRDELELTLGQAPAKGYASHGETWSLALALRLASYYVFCEDDPAPGAAPVLILDDVFAELDNQRRSKLAGIVASAEQVIVTAAVAEDIPKPCMANTSRWSRGAWPVARKPSERRLNPQEPTDPVGQIGLPDLAGRPQPAGPPAAAPARALARRKIWMRRKRSSTGFAWQQQPAVTCAPGPAAAVVNPGVTGRPPRRRTSAAIRKDWAAFSTGSSRNAAGTPPWPSGR